jgi:hypothetical protein
MSTSSINNLANGYLQQILGNLQGTTGLSRNPTPTSITQTSSQPADNGQLSPFAQVMSSLQQLQQSNPTEYQQVTAQIATNLQNAAQAATNEGYGTAAKQLNRLASDFTSASQRGQLPNIQDLAQAIGAGGGHHHHHVSSSDSDSSSSSSSTGSSSSTSSRSTATLQQLLSALQANSPQNDSLNPLSIITNTLAGAGIAPTNS